MSGNNESFIRTFSGAICLISLGILYLVFNGSSLNNGYLIDSQNYIMGRDFVNFWQYGIAAWQENPQTYYDPYWYNEHLDQLIPDFDYPDQLWSYPPHFMLMMAPFGLAGYNPALAAFTIAGLIVWWFVVIKPFHNKTAGLALLTTPFLVICLVSGQLSLFLAAFFVWLFRNIDARPILSGVLIALLTVKPHLGILIPLYLILTSRWLVFASAVSATLIFVGLSIFIHGLDVWQAYFDMGLKYQSQILAGSTTLVDGLMPTALMNMVVGGAGGKLAIAVHLVFAFGALCWFAFMVWKSNDHFIQFAALLVATFIISPYMMAYDFLVLIWVMIMLAHRQSFNQFHKTVFRLMVLLPVISVLMAHLAIPGSALVTVLLAIWLWISADINSSDYKSPDDDKTTQFTG